MLLLGGLSLLGGLDAALVLLGVFAPVSSPRLGTIHGMVMVLGFMGTVIALERAQALRQPWALLAPALLGAGALCLLAGLPPILGQLLLIQGAALLVLIHLALWRRAPLPVVAVQVASAVLTLGAASLWLVLEVPVLIAWLAGFLVLTIASERAELAQLSLGARALPILVGLTLAILIGAASSLVSPAVGLRIFGLALLLTAVWLLRDDIARPHLMRATGLRRYNGAALVLGYCWLAIAGTVWLLFGASGSTYLYDLVVHGVFLGFGVAMIMAHAPIILPTVIGRPLPYRPILWLPLVALQLGLVVRMTGALTAHHRTWQVGGVLSVISLLLFVLTAVGTVLIPQRQRGN